MDEKEAEARPLMGTIFLVYQLLHWDSGLGNIIHLPVLPPRFRAVANQDSGGSYISHLVFISVGGRSPGQSDECWLQLAAGEMRQS